MCYIRDTHCDTTGHITIHAILTETLASFLPGLAKDLSAPLYNPPSHGAVTPSVPSGLQAVPLQRKAPKEIHAILTETLAFFVPGLANDLLALLFMFSLICILKNKKDS